MTAQGILVVKSSALFKGAPQNLPYNRKSKFFKIWVEKAKNAGFVPWRKTSQHDTFLLFRRIIDPKFVVKKRKG